MNTKDRFEDFRKLSFMQSQIPALNALSTFVPAGQEESPQIRNTIVLKGFSRWFPVAGGHKVLIPYGGDTFDESTFKVEKGAWDHEHCKMCGADIKPMTLCWVTESGPYVILCAKCYEEMRKS